MLRSSLKQRTRCPDPICFPISKRSAQKLDGDGDAAAAAAAEREERNQMMLEGKARIQDTDMPLKMQSQATSCASYALDLFDVTDCKSIAAHIKRVCALYRQISLLLVV
jgi:hypothetical protein